MLESLRQKEANLRLKLQEAITLLRSCPAAEADARRAVRNAVALELDQLTAQIADAEKQQVVDDKERLRKQKEQQEIAKARRAGAPGTGLGRFSSKRTVYRTPEQRMAKKAEKSARDAEIRRSMQGMGGSKKKG